MIVLQPHSHSAFHHHYGFHLHHRSWCCGLSGWWGMARVMVKVRVKMRKRALFSFSYADLRETASHSFLGQYFPYLNWVQATLLW